MYKKIYAVLILSLFLVLGIYIVFIKEHEDISYIENRDYKTRYDLNIKNILNGEFQNNLDEVLMDQFPNRISLVEQKKKTEYNFLNIFYKMLRNPMLLNPIGDGYVNKIGNSDILMTSPLVYHKEWEERILRRIDQINKLQEDYPDIGIYVYKPTQIHETDFFDDANGIESAGELYGKLYDKLNVPYDAFKINEFDDYSEYFYTTDHHWNNRGSYLGYTEIINLMFDDEEILKPLDESCKNGLKFYGTYSSQSGFVTEGSDFCVYKFDLPSYRISDLNGEIEISNTNTFYDAEINQSLDYYYNIAYKVGDGYTHITSENIEKENILIIGDSYGGPILPLLAEHFYNIYFIYPTNYKALTGNDFNYDEFLDTHDIDKILFMYTIENYYLSDQWGDRYLDFDVIRKEVE